QPSGLRGQMRELAAEGGLCFHRGSSDRAPPQPLPRATRALRRSDPSLGSVPSPTYGATCRKRKNGSKTKLETWSLPLVTGQPLPTLPVWLSGSEAASLL